MNSSTIKQILSIQPCLISENDIWELYNLNHTREKVFAYIPKWVINEKHGNVMLAEYYLQHAGITKVGKSSSYYVFDVHSADPYLEREMSEAGLEWILKETQENWYELFLQNSSNIPGYNDFTKSCTDVIRIVLNLHYSVTYYEGIPEGDLEVTFDKILEL